MLSRIGAQWACTAMKYINLKKENLNIFFKILKKGEIWLYVEDSHNEINIFLKYLFKAVFVSL